MPALQPCCKECARPLAPRKTAKGSPAKFCSSGCRHAFNNRRMTRGAELYDYWMASRYNRTTHASSFRVVATQMAQAWRDADQIEMDGRESWNIPNLDSDPFALSADDRARKKAA